MWKCIPIPNGLGENTLINISISDGDLICHHNKQKHPLDEMYFALNRPDVLGMINRSTYPPDPVSLARQKSAYLIS